MSDRSVSDARARIRRLERRDRWATFIGVAVLAFGAVAGILVATGAGIGLVLVGYAARRALPRAKGDVFTLELARQAGEQAPAPPVTREEAPPFFRVVFGAGVLAVIAVFVSFAPSSKAQPTKQRWTFVDTATPAELGLTPRVATAGGWALEAHPIATGGRALVNHEGEPGSTAGILLVSNTRARDVRAMTRCKGERCGVAFRVSDEHSYTLARVDASSSRVELVAVTAGAERVIGEAPVVGGPEGWQELAVEARGDLVRIASNGRIVLETTIDEPATYGGVGLWSPAPSRAYFDELVVEPMQGPPQALEVLPLLGRRS